MKQELDALRINIDEVAQLTESMVYPSVVNVAVELRLAKAWGGYLSGELGGENPYKMNGKRHSVSDIEPTANKAVVSDTNEFAAKNLIEQIDYLREVIQAIADIINYLDTAVGESYKDGRKAAICRTQMWTHLVEAKILLGLELAKIREYSI